MPPKDKKKKGGGGGNDEDQRNQKLQAILLADSFKQNFRPITLERPQMLLPLVNVPMMEYTVEFLAQNGVEEIFIVCVWNADKLQEYVDSAKWSKGLTVSCIQMASCLSAGDALRELDSQGLIRSDPFVLISGDVVSNMNLKKAIEFHKARRKEDMNAIMTVVLKPIQKGAGSKTVMDDLVVALDKQTSQLLLFNDNIQQENIRVPLEIIDDHPSMVVRGDLLDCHVDVCSPELIMQFSDNFDYQDIRKDFIQNEVINWELGMHVYGYILNSLPPYSLSEYAARVQDPRTYHSICRDIVTRWVYPFVPDARLLRDDDSTPVRGKRNVYKEQGTTIARSATIGEGTVLGRDAVVEDHVQLHRTILGRGCKIGKACRIFESHLWAGAVVEAECKITQAILCENVLIKRGATIGRGCLISDGVVIGENVIIPEYSRITRLTKAEVERLEDGDSNFVGDDHGVKAIEVVGEDGKGNLYVMMNSLDWDSDEDDDEGIVPGTGGEGDDVAKKAREFPNRPVRFSREDYFRAMNIGCAEQEALRKKVWRFMPPPTDLDDEDDDLSELDGDEMGTFLVSVGDMVTSGRKDGHEASNLLMEIKGLKFAQNKTFSDCLRGVLPSMLALPFREAEEAGSGTPKVSTVLSQLKALLSSEEPQGGGWGYNIVEPLIQDTSDELTVIEAVEDAVLSTNLQPVLYGVFRMLLQMLYDEELVSQEALEEWIEMRRGLTVDDEDDDEEAEQDRKRAKLFAEPMVQALVEWLEQSDESEEGSDEDESEDDNED